MAINHKGMWVYVGTCAHTRVRVKCVRKSMPCFPVKSGYVFQINANMFEGRRIMADSTVYMMAHNELAATCNLHMQVLLQIAVYY
jgi:hypothetical protein